MRDVVLWGNVLQAMWHNKMLRPLKKCHPNRREEVFSLLTDFLSAAQPLSKVKTTNLCLSRDEFGSTEHLAGYELTVMNRNIN
uniref:LEM domain-containing protein n=1 Tax=Mesocestoides corti TaxID=53468 RepID=A0A5K3F626_MESCO